MFLVLSSISMLMRAWSRSLMVRASPALTSALSSVSHAVLSSALSHTDTGLLGDFHVLSRPYNAQHPETNDEGLVQGEHHG